jgi:hypothetical protein
MGIDGIGKAPPIAPPPGGPEPTGAASGSGGEFRVGEAAPAGSASALSRLERGELGFEQYLDARVAEATAHLAGRVTPEQLEFVKRTLRVELSSDPVLVELLQRATGKAASAAT